MKNSVKYENKDLSEFFLSLHENNKKIIYEDDDICIIFEDISYVLTDGKITDPTWSGYVLEK